MKRIAALTTCFVTFALPAIALGQGSSTCQAYNPQLVSSVGCGGGGNSPTSSQVTKTSPTSPNIPKVPSTSANVTKTAPSLPTVTLVSLTTHSSSLPFTGLDVVLLAAGGVTLLGAGLIVRRLSASTKK